MAEKAGQMAAYKRQQKARPEVPTGVKVVAVLFYIGTVISALSGIAALIGSLFIGTILQSLPSDIEGGGAISLFGNFTVPGMIIVGLFLIGIAALDFFIGRGLWRGRQWARILTIILMIIGAMFNLIALASGSFFSGSFGFLIDGAIAGYLLLNNDVKKAFY
jgi:hypothetical protein